MCRRNCFFAEKKLCCVMVHEHKRVDQFQPVWQATKDESWRVCQVTGRCFGINIGPRTLSSRPKDIVFLAIRRLFGTRALFFRLKNIHSLDPRTFIVLWVQGHSLCCVVVEWDVVDRCNRHFKFGNSDCFGPPLYAWVFGYLGTSTRLKS